MKTETFHKLEAIEAHLDYASSGDHYCEQDGCTIETPKCTDRHLQVALRQLREVLEPAHVSMSPERLSNDAERIYAEHWKRQNTRSPGLNGGYTLLEHLLCPRERPAGESFKDPMTGREIPERVSERDAAVAASVVQWLGTNCGQAFIITAEKEIEQARATRAEWYPFTAFNVEPQSEERRVAELVAAPAVGHPAHTHILRAVTAALAWARAQGALDKTVAPASLEATR